MSMNLIRFLANKKKKAQRYHVDALRYRGVVYKEIGWWCRRGSTPLPVIGRALTRIPLPCTVWKDLNIFNKKFSTL